MVFSSIQFLYIFLPIFILTYYLAGKVSLNLRNFVLLVFSVAFYMADGSGYVFLMIASATIDFIAGKAMTQFYAKNAGTNKKPKAYLLLSISANLGLLAYFKYSDFAIDIVNQFSSNFGFEEQYSHLNIVLPLGISFYTFQSMSYSIDIYRKQVQQETSYFRFLSFVTMFPQLIAGPIVRYTDIQKELKSRIMTPEKIEKGIYRFVTGLSKKVLIANSVGAYADLYYGLPVTSLDTLGCWIGSLCYALQIYFDFSGYSDMAIGLGQIIGFKFPENFNHPYSATSIQGFWRRWHMTLSTWFRDYLYIPLGGNRKGDFRTYFNQYAVFLLCGLWHGASFNFIFWGFYHGSFLTLEKITDKFSTLKHLTNNRLYFFVTVIVGWVFFRAETMTHAFSFLDNMFLTFSISQNSLNLLMSPGFLLPTFAGIFFSFPHKFSLNLAQIGSPRSFALHSTLLFINALILIQSSYNPFIYFRF